MLVMSTASSALVWILMVLLFQGNTNACAMKHHTHESCSTTPIFPGKVNACALNIFLIPELTYDRMIALAPAVALSAAI